MLFNVFGISHAQLRVILIFWVFFSRFHLVLYNEELLVLFSFCCFCVQKYAGAGIFVSFAEATAQRKREAANSQVSRAVACVNFIESKFKTKGAFGRRFALIESVVAFLCGFCNKRLVFRWCVPLLDKISQITIWNRWLNAVSATLFETRGLASRLNIMLFQSFFGRVKKRPTKKSRLWFKW